MKVLDLTMDKSIPLPTGGTFVHGMTDLEFIEEEIRAWLQSPEREAQRDAARYYDGKHDILNRRIKIIDENGEELEIKYLPNHRVVDNQYAKCVDQKDNYLVGKPFVFNCKNKDCENTLSKFFNEKRRTAIKNAVHCAIIGGKAWIMPCYTADGVLEFSVLTADSVCPFWADAAHTELDCAIHLYEVEVYNGDRTKERVTKVEILHGGGINRYIYKDGRLVLDPDAPSGAYVTVNGVPQNWERMPLVCLKANTREQPLLNRVRGLQDQLNLKVSDLMNALSSTVYNSVIVLENYDDEDAGNTRANIMATGVVKVRSVDGVKGDARILDVKVDVDSYKKAIDHLKQSVIDNARCYDAKDDRLGTSPNQMNIQSMYSDLDLDANGMETHLKAAIYELLWFVFRDLENKGKGRYDDEIVEVIFNRDILINESEAIENCGKSTGVLSEETIVKQHPWVNDPAAELKRIERERSATSDPYKDAFPGPSGQAVEADE